MLDYIEKEWLDKPQIHDFHAGVINNVIEKYNAIYLLEIGCGTGNVAKRLKGFSAYNGIDLNKECIDIAKQKNPDMGFGVYDIRYITWEGGFNLVFTFGFLKHFGLHEWSTIFQKVCSLGEYLVFDIPIAENTHDDGTEYHHVWLSMEDIKRNIDDNGFEILEIKEFGVEPVFICKRNEVGKVKRRNYRKNSSDLEIISDNDYKKLTDDTKRNYFATSENATHEVYGDFEDHNYVIRPLQK